MKKGILTLALFIVLFGNSQNIKVRLFSNAVLSSSWVTTHNGDYFLIATDNELNPIDTVDDIFKSAELRTLNFSKKGKKVAAFRGGEKLGNFNGYLLSTSSDSSHFIIKGKGAERIYEGNLYLRVYQGELQIINSIAIEPYVEGVVESEGGHAIEMEYFKAQAVLARTWVLRNMNKHTDEGYNVKDDVTSQAYYSKAYLQNSTAIKKAVLATKDSVLLDKSNKLVMGAFHSNSGGQTSNSQDIWSREIEYLSSVKDTFSIKGSRAQWEKELDKESFIAYFSKTLGASSSDKELRKAIVSISMPNRKPWFEYNGKKVKMRNVRTKFKLRSSFFSVEDKGKTVLLKGKGFGHGVGLSQQGAMEMAKHSYTYQEILMFYFKGTHLALKPNAQLLN